MTGFHGANRLASNSLLEALVMAKRAFQHACRQRRPVLASDLAWPPGSRRTTGQVPALRERLQRCMWEKVGIIRTDRGLEDACREIAEISALVEQPHPDHLPDPQLVALRNMITTAGLVGRAARLRLESRGGHYNSDHPERDDARWQAPILMQKDNAGLPIEVRR